jgi:hypothetical protein
MNATLTTPSKLDILKDTRVDCYSVIIKMTIGEYLDMTSKSFENKGGIEGQRDSLKTSTAKRIRKRMITDLEAGAVLPPIVIGTIVEDQGFLKQLEQGDFTEDSFRESIREIPDDDIFIIDGIQRTTAIREAVQAKSKIKGNKLRIEWWLASKVNAITYRMLVLNTGQLPWNLRRQIEVVFSPMIKELEAQNDKIKISKETDNTPPSRRYNHNPCEFHADHIVEMYLAFGAKKEKVDVQEKLADEFTRQDFIEAAANPDFNHRFYQVIDYLLKFDIMFGKYDGSEKIESKETKEFLKKGKDLFRSQPACLGFVTAFSQEIMGMPGEEYSYEDQQKKWKQITQNADQLLNKLEQKNSQEIGEFLNFDVLNELISKKTSKMAGYYQREFYLAAFKLLIDRNFDVFDMTVCWRKF